jgi:hypothetical protein
MGWTTSRSNWRKKRQNGIEQRRKKNVESANIAIATTVAATDITDTAKATKMTKATGRNDPGTPRMRRAGRAGGTDQKRGIESGTQRWIPQEKMRSS